MLSISSACAVARRRMRPLQRPGLAVDTRARIHIGDLADRALPVDTARLAIMR